MIAKDVRIVVDQLLDEPKTLYGIGQWRQVNREDRPRWTSAIVVRKQVSEISLEIHAHPRESVLKFSISLLYGRSIWRLDYGVGVSHINAFDVPFPASPGVLEGSHYHSWQDNRHLSTSAALPRELKVARLLPPSIRTFEQAFRWFCGETGITVRSTEIPDLPKTDLLL